MTVAMVAIALLTVEEYLLGHDLGIDEWFVRDPVSVRNGLPPGRMALATALAFIATGLAVLLIAISWWTLAQYVALASILIALFSLTAYLFGERSVTMISPYTSLAVNTAVGMFILGVGLLGQCAEAGPMAVFVADDSGGVALRRLLPLTVVATVSLGLMSAFGVRFGLYSFAVALVIFSVASSVVLAVAIWSNSRSLSRSEAERRRDLDRYRLTLTSIGDAVIATDGQGRVTFLNAVAERLTGWRCDEAPGATAGRGVPDRQRGDQAAGREPRGEGPGDRPDRRPGQPHGPDRARRDRAADRRQRCADPGKTTARSRAWSWSSTTCPRSSGRSGCSASRSTSWS